MPEWELESLDRADAAGRSRVAAFLGGFGLGYDPAVDLTLTAKLDGRIVGTGSFAGEVIRNVAVDEDIRGEGLNTAIVDRLVREQARRGILHNLIFTKPAAAPRFAGLGFKEIARAEPWAVLLEGGLGSVDDYVAGVARAARGLPAERGAAVVNCNPFTLGHRALIERAATRSAGLIVFVVQEDRSLFPFADRIDLVRRGLAHLPNVVVVPTGIYMVSSATFPTYFTREEQLAAAQAHLDIALFAGRIAPPLGIRTRYVGQEPYCAVTEAYNQAMRDLLPAAGIGLDIMPRVEAGGRIVSASTVRDLIRAEDWEGVRALVPEVTWEYLRSPGRADLLARIRASSSRH